MTLSCISVSQLVIQGIFSISSPSLCCFTYDPPFVVSQERGVLWQGVSGMSLKTVSPPSSKGFGMEALTCPGLSPSIWILDYPVGLKRQTVP